MARKSSTGSGRRASPLPNRGDASRRTDAAPHRQRNLGHVAATDAGGPSWWRLGGSILIIGQLWAIVGRPIEFATQGPTGPSPAATVFFRPVRGYSEFAYLNHGYAFFAPDPGPSHLVRATLRPEQGPARELWYPDLEAQWPRLLYHRHFMLTEFLHNTFQPAELPPDLAENPEVAQRWEMDRGRFEAIRDSFANHLRTEYGVPQVQIQRVEHQLVGLPEFLYDGQRLDDPALYIDLPDRLDETLPDQPPGAESTVPRFGVPQPPANRIDLWNQPTRPFPTRQGEAVPTGAPQPGSSNRPAEGAEEDGR